MGLLAGFGSGRVQMIREGFAYEPNPDAAAPRLFRHVVGDPGYQEAWIEGLDVYHDRARRFRSILASCRVQRTCGCVTTGRSSL